MSSTSSSNASNETAYHNLNWYDICLMEDSVKKELYQDDNGASNIVNDREHDKNALANIYNDTINCDKMHSVSEKYRKTLIDELMITKTNQYNLRGKNSVKNTDIEKIKNYISSKDKHDKMVPGNQLDKIANSENEHRSNLYPRGFRNTKAKVDNCSNIKREVRILKNNVNSFNVIKTNNHSEGDKRHQQGQKEDSSKKMRNEHRHYTEIKRRKISPEDDRKIHTKGNDQCNDTRYKLCLKHDARIKSRLSDDRHDRSNESSLEKETKSKILSDVEMSLLSDSQRVELHKENLKDVLFFSEDCHRNHLTHETNNSCAFTSSQEREIKDLLGKDIGAEELHNFHSSLKKNLHKLASNYQKLKHFNVCEIMKTMSNEDRIAAVSLQKLTEDKSIDPAIRLMSALKGIDEQVVDILGKIKIETLHSIVNNDPELEVLNGDIECLFGSMSQKKDTIFKREDNFSRPDNLIKSKRRSYSDINRHYSVSGSIPKLMSKKVYPRR